MAACPICKNLPLPRPENSAFPFCSPRCKQIDLANWLTESYRVPVEGEASEGSDSDLERAS